MSTEQYQIVFSGEVLEGFEPADVKANLQTLFQLSDDQAEKLFGPNPVVIKSGLSAERAEQYVERLSSAGADVQMKAESNSAVAPEPESVPVEASVEPTVEPMQAEAAPSPAEPERKPVENDDIREAGFQFTGSGKEYFGIWIVNILLTIVTFGIYSAWATVRNNQYFYGNTQVDGSSFQYLAKPLTILKGRLIALAVFAVYVILSEMFVEAALFFAVLFIPVVPWIMIKSLRFRAVNSSFRNVRFDFEGRYGQAFMVTFVWPLLNLFTLLLLTPFVIRKTHEFVASGSRYGTSEFSFNATVGEYYRFFGIALAILLGGVLGAYLGKMTGVPALGVIIGAVAYLALIGYFLAGMANLFINAIQLQDHGFSSDLQPGRMLWIYLSNSVVVALTLGLATPWAKCRLARYRAECTSMLIAGNLDQFVAAEENRTSALGQELGDAFDVGFAGI